MQTATVESTGSYGRALKKVSGTLALQSLFQYEILPPTGTTFDVGIPNKKPKTSWL